MEILNAHLYKVSQKLNFYKSRRTDDSFYLNISVTADNFEFFDKNKRLLSIDKNEIYKYSEDSFLHIMYRFLKEKQFANIKVVKDLLFISTYSDIADEIYILSYEVKNLTNLINSKILRNFNHLDDSKIPFFLYLAANNYLNHKIVLLYRNILLIYTSDGEFNYFYLNIGKFLNLNFSKKNEFLGCFSFLKDNVICMFDLKTCNNIYISFSKYNQSLCKYLNSYKYKEIQKLVKEKKYLQCSRLPYFNDFIKSIKVKYRHEICNKFYDLSKIH